MGLVRRLFGYRKFAILRSQRGVAAVEFAIAFPLLILLTFGTIEVTRYVQVTQKLERVVITISDLVAQNETISTATLNLIIPAAAEILKPYDFSPDGYVIISSVKKIGTGNPTVTWQYKSSSSAPSSQIGNNGAVATLPTSFTMLAGDAVIITEFFYVYRPLMTGVIYTQSNMYRYSIFKPRLGDLSTLSFYYPARQKESMLCVG